MKSDTVLSALSMGIILLAGSGCSAFKARLEVSSKRIERFQHGERYAGAQAHPGGYCEEYTSPKTGTTSSIRCVRTPNNR